ncbi:MAG: glycine cleavage system protein GcvH [Bacteroidales bacterium]|jgi:glycine cleavage system H protein|nr:glycine cleavage system protein GcvH [Bacteroidales bacterium]OQC03797.1 MAG: Glycine cleavage system H protein [Bacteroidetes bacterium ADurb.Bin090]MBP8981577.1 glycine cleavage system protein GcvH [Bacteroidales bacterium]HNZ80597.1 glycine cleavage system protein GcvH [Bacteroidales bacterium]HOD26433.1 glycine cleavage system protein GcvH [Bacteroidales bacterium]
MNDPKTLKFTKNHEWIRVEGQEAYVGISDFAQSELGEIVYVDITTVGESLQKEEVFGSVEAVKAVSDLFIPVGGTVLEANAELEDHPELINKEPYDAGWIIKISLNNSAELQELLSYEQYKEMIG